MALVARLRVEVRRGNDRAARALPAGPIIVISNHTSHADGVLLALACRRMGRSLRLLATSGVFRVPLLGSLTVGEPLRLGPEETKPAFLQRAREAVQQLAR